MDALRHLHRPALCVHLPSSSAVMALSLTSTDIYHVSFTRDHRFIQASVYLIFLLELFQSIVAANQGWQVLVSGWGHPNNLEFPGWTFTALPIVSTISECLASASS